MGYQPPLPNSSRLIDWGHSWVAPPPYPYAVSNPASFDILGNNTHPWTGEQWPMALRDALGIGSSVSYYRTYSVPAVTTATTNTTTFLDLMPDDGTIDAVYYVPNGTITTNASNYRSVSISIPDYALTATLAVLNFTSGTVTIGLAQKVWSMNDLMGFSGSSPTMTYMPALRGVSSSAAQINQAILWTSSHTGSGQTDPGGTVIIRYGTRYRNYAVGGSTLLASGAGWNLTNGGGWPTCFAWSPFSRPNAIEVNLTAASSSGSGTLTCSPLQYPIHAGATITFAGGTTFTVGASAIDFEATSISGTGPTANLSAGQQGHAAYNNGLGGGDYETLSPTGINVWTHGVNDADNATQDVNAWQETVRSVISRCACPALLTPDQGNAVFTAGGGTWATLALITGGWAALPFPANPYNVLGLPLPFWTGTVSGSPSVAVSIGPAFEGGTVDLMFIAPAGSSMGVAGTVTVDGGTPPQGTVTLNSSGVSISGLLAQSPGGTISASGTTTITGSSTTFTADMVGCLLTASGGTGSIPAGTIITAYSSATSVTVNNTVTVSGATPTVQGWVPMTKRITGLASGAHTVTFTITGSDSVANSMLMFYGLGLESQNPTTPVLWCDIAETPSMNSTQKANAAALNTASSEVIAGTYTPLTGNTQEPAFGVNVQYVDINSVFTGNAQYFLFDGLHFNSRGHRKMANILYNTIQTRFTPGQLISR